MSQTARFNIEQVLSVVTPYFVCQGGIGELYEILNWLTGENLMTHQLPRAAKSCSEFLAIQLPELAADAVKMLPSNIDEGGEWDWKSWRDSMEAKYGNVFDLPAMPNGEFYKAIDPLNEPILKGKKVIVIKPEDEL